MPAQINKKVTKKQPRTLKVYLAWQVPSRPFKKRNREFFSTIGAIVLLLVIILVFFKEWLLIAVIIAMAFTAYILATVPPGQIKHQITNRGITTANKNYFYKDLTRFWIGEKLNQKVLYVETSLGFPKRLMFLLGQENQDQIKKLLTQYLPQEEPEKTWIDNAGIWLSQKFPLE